jgi:hypothetical protein
MRAPREEQGQVSGRRKIDRVNDRGNRAAAADTHGDTDSCYGEEQNWILM